MRHEDVCCFSAPFCALPPPQRAVLPRKRPRAQRCRRLKLYRGQANPFFINHSCLILRLSRRERSFGRWRAPFSSQFHFSRQKTKRKRGARAPFAGACRPDRGRREKNKSALWSHVDEKIPNTNPKTKGKRRDTQKRTLTEKKREAPNALPHAFCHIFSLATDPLFCASGNAASARPKDREGRKRKKTPTLQGHARH